MCDVTALAWASLAMAGAGTAVQYDQEKKNAQAQNKVNDRNYESALQAFRDNTAAVGLQNQQEWKATTQQAEENDLATRQTMAQARVAAGESGIMGNTVDSLFREIAGNGGRNKSNIYENYLMTHESLDGQLRGIRNQTESVVSGLAPVKGPSALAAGLRIGGQALGTYAGYKSGSFGQDGNQWKK